MRRAARGQENAGVEEQPHAPANLVFDGGTLQYTGSTASTNRNVTINTGKTAIFDITANNLTVSGASTATNGALTKIGAGTLTLTGANLNSGKTTITAGILQTGDGSTTGNFGGGAVIDNSTIEFKRSDFVTVGNAISGTGALIQSGSGSTALTATNSFSDATTINAGTLEAAGAGTLGGTTTVAFNTGGSLLLSGTGDRVNDSAAFTMNGGTIVNAVNGVTEQLGTLTLTQNSVLDFGSFVLGSISFADSHLASWTGGTTLSIYNWTGGNDHLFAGTVDHSFDGINGGLQSSQLLQISFFSGTNSGFRGTGTFLPIGLGEIVPVPEPSSVATVVGLLGLIGWRERRKSRLARATERRASSY